MVSFRLPLRVTEGREILLESERERQDDTWILLEPLGDEQIGDSVEQGGADLQRQRHGLVIRGGEAARAIRVDAVVLQRRTDLRNWADGQAFGDSAWVGAPPRALLTVKVKRRSTRKQKT